MKTELRDFCIEYADMTAPLSTELAHLIGRIDTNGKDGVLGDTRNRLADAQHRLKILTDRLERQQTYLLIFGPLKSGKSTLMNAISAAYVSEVSSLPAYPCLVYARHDEEPSMSATTYGGQVREVASKDALQQLVEQEHRRLAAKLQEVEERGEDFDPQQHFPEALRRIDIGLPAAELTKSGIVLVDTPGLYTRMNFGYDLMTRDFRDTAACAVFVVKTENLFLEQVFAEFNELLEIFSRVFLVVNIDAGKKDLAPDGSLCPSVESETPQRIVDAFESLSMDAPLRQAHESGRLRIYPIDLLGTAAERLAAPLAPLPVDAPPPAGVPSDNTQTADSSEPDDTADDASPGEAEAAAVVAPPDAMPDNEANDSFQLFLNDLSDYLNSSDYLTEFKLDSVHQGELVAGELHNAVTGGTVQALRPAIDARKQELRDIKTRLDAVGTAGRVDWNAAFQPATDDVSTAVRDQVKSISGRLRQELETALDAWFESDESLAELRDTRFAGLLETEVRQAVTAAREAVQARFGGNDAGATLDGSVAVALNTIGIALGDLARDLPDTVGEGLDVDLPAFALNIDEIPVRRSFLDYLLFRGPGTVRRRLCGNDGENAMSMKHKTRRLGTAARDYLAEQARTVAERDLVTGLCACVDDVISRHAGALRTSMDRRLKEINTDLLRQRAEAERAQADLAALQQLSNALAGSVEGFQAKLSDLREAHVPVPAATEEPEAKAPENETEASLFE